MEIFKILFKFLSINLLIINLSLIAESKDKFSITNNTNIPIDVELLFYMKVLKPFTGYQKFVRKIEPNQTDEFKLEELVHGASFINTDSRYIQTINVWKAGKNREDHQNFLGVLLDPKIIDPNKALTCSFENKPKNETSKYKNDQERLEYGMYNMKCKNTQANWLAGTSAGWTRRAH